MDNHWFIKLTYPGASFYTRSTIEPKWINFKEDKRLRYTEPAEISSYPQFNDKLQAPVLRSHLLQWSFSERDVGETSAEISSKKASKVKRDKERVSGLDTVASRNRKGSRWEDFRSDVLSLLRDYEDIDVNYTFLRAKSGIPMRYFGAVLIELNREGLIIREKEGRNTLFSLTPKGYDQLGKE